MIVNSDQKDWIKTFPHYSIWQEKEIEQYKQKRHGEQTLITSRPPKRIWKGCFICVWNLLQNLPSVKWKKK